MLDQRYVYPDSGLVSLRQFEPAATFCPAEPFDAICRRLSEAYLSQCWQHLSASLPEFGLDPHSCQWGSGHPGLMWAPRGSEEHPFEAVGWWFPESAVDAVHGQRPTPTWWHPVWTDIDARLRSLDPPLMVTLHGYRSWVLRGANDEVLAVDDAAAGLAYLRSASLDEISSWRGRLDAGTGPWAELAAALWHRDPSAFDAGLRRAFEAYAPVATEIVVRGFAGYAVHWLSPDAPLCGPRAGELPR